MEPSSRPLIRLPARAACQPQGVVVRQTKRGGSGGRDGPLPRVRMGVGAEMLVVQKKKENNSDVKFEGVCILGG